MSESADAPILAQGCCSLPAEDAAAVPYVDVLCRVIHHPPDNGLVVPHLVDVARRVHAAREGLLGGLTRLVEGEGAIPVKRCR